MVYNRQIVRDQVYIKVNRRHF